MPEQQGNQQQDDIMREVDQLEDNVMEGLLEAVLSIVETLVGTISEDLLDQITRRAPRIPYHTSALSGSDWVDELLSGHPQRIRNELGVNRGTFILLRKSLQLLGIDSSRHVSIDEQLAIFLYIAVTGLGCIHAAERFQRSPSTITKYFKRILEALSTPPFFTLYVQLPEVNSPIPPKIRNEPKFYPFFEGALGALDGTHIRWTTSAEDSGASRNRKGEITQNCLAACTFDLRFTYFMSGWEGSTHDSTLFSEARQTDFHIPKGRYYLADAGFASSDALLVPFRNVRYHLSEWDRAKQRPRNPEELFNLRHASARNVERIFGVVKRRFRILRLCPEYDIRIQARVPSALAALHNFIRIYDPDDIDTDVDEPLDFRITAYPMDVGELGGQLTAAERARANARRDKIAADMWEQYQRYLGLAAHDE